MYLTTKSGVRSGFEGVRYSIPNASMRLSSSSFSKRDVCVALEDVAWEGEPFRPAALEEMVEVLMFKRSFRRRGCGWSDTVECRERRPSSRSRTRERRLSILSCNSSVFARTMLIRWQYQRVMMIASKAISLTGSLCLMLATLKGDI
jgi:hypothetical protein